MPWTILILCKRKKGCFGFPVYTYKDKNWELSSIYIYIYIYDK